MTTELRKRVEELEQQLADKLNTVTRYAESSTEGGGVCEDNDGEFVSMYDVAKVLGLRLTLGCFGEFARKDSP